MLKIGVKYTRTEPNNNRNRSTKDGRETEVHIKNREEQQYHIGLEKEGYTYTEVVYKGTCTSCEG